MSLKVERHTDLYDMFYATKPYPNEAASVHHACNNSARGKHALCLNDCAALVRMRAGSSNRAMSLWRTVFRRIG